MFFYTYLHRALCFVITCLKMNSDFGAKIKPTAVAEDVAVYRAN